MNCPQCGRSLPESARFCGGCGQPVQAAPVQTEPVSRPAATYAQAVKTPLMDTPYQTAFKKLVRSPLMMCTLIFFIISILANIAVAVVSSVTTLADNIRFYYYADSMYGIGDGEDIIAIVVGAIMALFASLVGALPTVLIAIGLFMTRHSAGRSAGMSSAGLTMIKVILIILLAYLGMIALLYMGIFALLLLVVIVGFAKAGSMALVPVIMIAISTIITMSVCAFVIFLYVRMIATVNAGIDVIKHGAPKRKVSVLVAVYCILLALGCVVYAVAFVAAAVFYTIPISYNPELAAFYDLYRMYANYPFVLMAIQQLIGAVPAFLFALLIFKFRSKVQKLVVPAPAPECQDVTESVTYNVPVAEHAVTVEPTVEAPIEEEPVVESLVAEEPIMEEPVVEESAAEEPARPTFVFCGECGQKLVPTAKFCSRCGHPQ